MRHPIPSLSKPTDNNDHPQNSSRPAQCFPSAHSTTSTNGRLTKPSRLPLGLLPRTRGRSSRRMLPPGSTGQPRLQDYSLRLPGRVCYHRIPSYCSANHVLIGPSFKPTTVLRTGGLNDISNRNAQVSPKTPNQLQFGVTPSKPLDFPGTILRPSASRRSVRKSRGSIFETPDAQGRRPHWEDIDSASPTVSPVQALVNEILEEDDSEIEYVPPPCTGTLRWNVS